MESNDHQERKSRNSRRTADRNEVDAVYFWVNLDFNKLIIKEILGSIYLDDLLIVLRRHRPQNRLMNSPLKINFFIFFRT